MLSENLRKLIDRIWNTLWAGRLSNPLAGVEQITYLLFMKLIGDNVTRAEKNATMLDQKVINPVSFAMAVTPVISSRMPYSVRPSGLPPSRP